MRARILHESGGRLRIHFYRSSFSLEEADRLEYYLADLSGVEKARVSERTGNATVLFPSGSEGRAVRDAVIQAISIYDPEKTEVAVPDHTGREIRHEYTDKMARHILGRIATRTLLPLPVRTVITLVKAVPYFIKGLKSLSHLRLEVSVLDAASIAVSMLRGDFDTAGNVMFLLGIGDIMDEWTRKKSVNDLARSMSLNIDKVWVRTGDGTDVLTPIATVREGDRVVVRTGGMIPLDGTVSGGEASVNQASITGEALPVHKAPGGYVYAGTTVEEGEILVSVKKTSGSGQYDRITAMIQESEKLKSGAEIRAYRMADRLVPYTFGATALTWLITRNASRATAILMVDFCCALKLSMPIAVLSAMREAGEHHISVKGGKVMEDAAAADTIVFDKTGTLTNACPTVADLIPFGGNDPAEMLRLAACLEEHYPHSMANAVVKAAADRGLEHDERHSRVEYVVAHGIASSIDGQKVVIGSYHFVFEDEGCVIPAGEEEKFRNISGEYSHLFMAIGGVLSAVILIDDPVKAEAAETVAKLHSLGFTNIVMMTGDSRRVAKRIAGKVGVDTWKAEVLPEDKAAYVKEQRTLGHKVIMVGDGVNDALALSEADVGVAVNSGAMIARQVADVTISESNLESLVTLRQLSMALQKRIHGNYRKIVGFNSGLILLGAAGVLPPTVTALLHNTSTILISLRSMENLEREGETPCIEEKI